MTLAIAGVALLPGSRLFATTGAGPCADTVGQILDSASIVAALLYFQQPTFLKDYVQSIEIGYTAPPIVRAGRQSPQQASIERTGFFSVGAVSVGEWVMLPIVKR